MSTHKYTKIALVIFDVRNAEGVSMMYGQALAFVKSGVGDLRRTRWCVTKKADAPGT